jgi:outer membrane protein TolC
MERFRRIEPRTFEPAPPKQPETAEQTARDIAADRFAGREEAELTLEECRASALEHNLDLQVALVNPTIANQALSEEEAAFEASFDLNANWRQTDTPTSSSLDDAQANGQSVTPGVTIPLRTGGTTSVSLPMSRNETSNMFATLNPAYTADLRFSISQPLLRNAGRRASTFGIKIASYGEQIAEAQTKLAVINQLAAVDRAYWRLYQARAELDVRQQEFDLAVEQLERAQRRVAAEAAAEIEVLRAQAGVADSLEAIIVAQNLVLSTQRELKRIINMPGLDVDTSTMVVPASSPDPVEYVFDPSALIEEAVAQRMDLLEVELQIARDAASIRFRENQAMPALDLAASYQINGLGESLGDAYEILGENQFEDWTVGLNLSVPIGNEASLARLRQAVLQRVQRISTRDSRLQTVRQEVLDAIDRLQADWQRLQAAQISVALNTRNLEAEQRQFEQGRTTSTDVLDATRDLTLARSTEIRAIVSYQLTQIDLAVATGTLLGASRVSWTPAEAPALDSRYFPGVDLSP